LDGLECQNSRFLWIFWQFQAAAQISRANCTGIDRDRHGVIDSLSLDFLDSRKPAQKGIKER